MTDKSNKIDETDKTRPSMDEEAAVREQEGHHTQLGCGILGRYPIASLLSFVVIGVGAGVGLSYWEPSNPNAKVVTLQWLGLFGDLFLRALKAIVLPIVFVNVLIAVVDMMNVGAAGGVGGKTVGFYLLTTLCAGTIGVISTLIFQRWYTVGNVAPPGPTYITLGCDGQDSYLKENADGTVECTSDWLHEQDILWVFGDYNSSFVTKQDGTVADVSLSDTIYNGVFRKLITDNIFREFTEANFAAIVVFAIAMGVAIAKILKRLQVEPKDFTLMSLLMDLDKVLGTMIVWVIMCTPFAVCSMIVATIGGQDDLAEVFIMVSLLVGCTLLALGMQVCIVYCGLYLAFIRKSPRKYFRAIAPAQIMAFASASSAATIPVSIESTVSSGDVPQTIANFVIPLGATVNMDGAAIYFPCACIWLAICLHLVGHLQWYGITPTPADYILLVIIATFGSMGTAPVPNAALALIVTAYNTVFGTTGTPDGFSYIFAIDWFMDRTQTVVNVTGDTFVTAIISHICPLDKEIEEKIKEGLEEHDQDHHFGGELQEVGEEFEWKHGKFGNSTDAGHGDE